MDPNPVLKLTVTGEMSGDRIRILEEEFLPELRSNPQSLIFDLKNVSRIDSCGISLCIKLSKECISREIDFLIEAGQGVYRIFEQINLINVVKIKKMY